MFLSGDFFFLFETLKNKTPFDELSFTLQYKIVKNKIWTQVVFQMVELKGIPAMNLRTVIGNMYHHRNSRKESWTRR